MRRSLLAALTVVAVSLGYLTGAEAQTFSKINVPGFGDPKNKYALSMLNFKDRVYVGTLNASFALTPDQLDTVLQQYGDLVARGHNTVEIFLDSIRIDGKPLWDYIVTDGAEIWERDGGTWTKVLDMGDEMATLPNIGIRSLIQYDTLLVAGTLTKGQAQIWTSPDGHNWSLFHTLPGANFSAWSMAVWEGKLYVGTANRDGAQVWSYDDADGWVQVYDFTGTPNFAVSAMAVYRDELYFGTLNAMTGFEVWKIDDHHNVTNVLSGGIDGERHLGVYSLYPYRDELYLGTASAYEGFALLRYNPWNGWRRVDGNGLGDRSNAIASSMTEYCGRLFLGTFNTGLWEADTLALPPLDQGGQLWKSDNGTAWDQVEANGFGDSLNTGMESMTVANQRLYVGTASNLFLGPGTEIWASEEGALPVAKFNSNRNVGYPPLDIQYADESTGRPTWWHWWLGDRTETDQRAPLHRYWKHGTKDVSLAVGNSCGTDTTTVENFIDVYGPCSGYAELVLIDSSASFEDENWSNAIDGDTYGWDGTVTTDDSPPWAIFAFKDTSVQTVKAIRLLTDTHVNPKYRNRLVTKFHVDVSTTGLDSSDFTTILSATRNTGDWVTYEIDPPVEAKYIRLVLDEPTSGWRQIGEFEVRIVRPCISELQSTIQATSPHLADGVDSSIVTITLVDTAGNPVTGVPPEDFHLFCLWENDGEFGAVAETDSPGVYQTTLRTTHAGTKTLRAVVWGAVIQTTTPGTLTPCEVEFLEPYSVEMPLTLVESSDAWPGEGWDNLIDGDISGWDGTVTAYGNPCYAILAFADGGVHYLADLQLKTDTGVGYEKRWVRRFHLDVSATGTDSADFKTVFTGSIPNGEWNKYRLPAVPARYVRLVVDMPGTGFRQLAEMKLRVLTKVQPLPEAPIRLIASSDAWPGEGWDNAIDGDTEGWDGTVTAMGDPPWAIFGFGDGVTKTIDKVGLLTDTGVGYESRWVTKFEIQVSTTDTTDSAFTTVLVATKREAANEMEYFQFSEPVQAKYVKLILLEPSSGFRQIGEFEVHEVIPGEPILAEKKAGEFEAGLPTTFDVGRAYPNPFNPETQIPYQLPEKSHVRITIFNALGQQVATLVDADVPAGYHSVRWNGRDALGQVVPSGVYLYRFEAGNVVKVGRLLLLK